MLGLCGIAGLAPTAVAERGAVKFALDISADSVGETPTAGSYTYYVDAALGDDANLGTSEAGAWKTLSRASAALLTPGDRLLLKRGSSWTERLELTVSGISGAPIEVSAYGSGPPPMIRGVSSCVVLAGSYLILRDLAIDDCAWAGVEVSGNENRVESNVITRNVVGVYVRPGAVGTKVLRNELHDNNKMSILTEGGDDDAGAWGIRLDGDRTEVAYNTISGSDAFSYDYGRDGAAVEVYGGRENTIRHNLAVDNDVFTELGNSRSADNTFAYNVVRSSLATSRFLVTRGPKNSFGPVVRTRVYNNFVLLTGQSSEGFVCFAGCGPDILTMHNNVIQAVAKVGFADAPFDEDADVFYGGLRQFQRGASSVVADPAFVDAAAGDLHVLATSPAVDRGVDLGYTLDYDGRPVPQDGNGDGQAQPDAGAFEYVPDTTPPKVTITTDPADTPDPESGWFNLASSGEGGVAIEAAASDPSGVASLSCSVGETTALTAAQASGRFTLQDGFHWIACSATDTRGNTGAGPDSTYMPASFAVDQTPPRLTCLTPSSTTVPSFLLEGAGGDVGAAVTDATSGLARTTVSAHADVSSTGRKSVSLTAWDLAGNQATTTCDYLVGYRFLGFFAPLGRAAYEAGATIPLRFALANAAGESIPDGEAAALAASCTVRISFAGAAHRCASYDPGSDTFRLNLKTSRALAPGSYTLSTRVYVGPDLVTTKDTELLIRD